MKIRHTSIMISHCTIYLQQLGYHEIAQGAGEPAKTKELSKFWHQHKRVGHFGLCGLVPDMASISKKCYFVYLEMIVLFGFGGKIIPKVLILSFKTSGLGVLHFFLHLKL